MLIDKVTLHIKAGKGGDGVVRWRREKGIPFGGPAGGDGGKGGDVYFRVVRDVTALSRYISHKEWEGAEGEAGQKRSMHGKSAEDLYLEIPLGSVIHNREYDIRYECLNDGQIIKILKGGKGGLGNENFKSSVNRAPEEFTKGDIGEFATFEIELKLVADIGLIGFPNAGKSSLLNSLTRAGAKVGDYAFTTLEPNLGAYFGLVLADIPGLIEGASDGKGLGHKFLRHITRTNVLAHLIEATHDDVTNTYDVIRKELASYDTDLMKLSEIIILSKSDMIDEKDVKKKIKTLEKHTGKKVYELSLFVDESIKEIGKVFLNTVKKEEKVPEVEEEDAGDAAKE